MTGTCDPFKMFSFSVMQSTFRFSNVKLLALIVIFDWFVLRMQVILDWTVFLPARVQPLEFSPYRGVQGLN